MLPEEIANESLQLQQIPASDAAFEVVEQFGYTFNGFKQLGSFAACADIANEPLHNTLTELRACLFFEQRRWHHYGDTPDAEAVEYQRGLVEKIRIKVAANERA
ncbi:hypothetical protein [Nevskia ramosa]|uniref:hypothetical protein n=1 Tax=Nevskia ramosa TaxID=64002 RepID=UPI0023550127|nr:hypothetical protein [Nevskia ramosa]